MGSNSWVCVNEVILKLKIVLELVLVCAKGDQRTAHAIDKSLGSFTPILVD